MYLYLFDCLECLMHLCMSDYNIMSFMHDLKFLCYTATYSVMHETFTYSKDISSLYEFFR